MYMAKSIGIIGGTGKQGSALAKRLAKKGYSIAIGSRSDERGKQKAADLSKEKGLDNIRGGSNEIVTECDIVIISIPFSQVADLLLPLKEGLTGKILIDMTVNLLFGKSTKAQFHEGKSSYEFIRDHFTESLVVAAFKTISYVVLGGDQPIDQSDFQISDSEEALAVSSQLARDIGLVPIRIIGDHHAHTIERMVALAININKNYKGSHAGYLMTNLKV